MKSLTTLAAERNALSKTLDRTQKIPQETEAKIEKILEEGDLDDPKLAKELAELRTKIELVPAKVRHLETAITKLDAEQVRPAIRDVVRKLNAVANEERAAALTGIHAALRPFIPDLRSDAPVVFEIYSLSSAYLQRISLLQVSFSQVETYISDAGESAAFLLKLAADHKIDLDKLPEVPAYVPPVNLGFDPKTGKAIQPGEEIAESSEPEAVEEAETVSQS